MAAAIAENVAPGTTPAGVTDGARGAKSATSRMKAGASSGAEQNSAPFFIILLCLWSLCGHCIKKSEPTSSRTPSFARAACVVALTKKVRPDRVAGFKYKWSLAIQNSLRNGEAQNLYALAPNPPMRAQSSPPFLRNSIKRRVWLPAIFSVIWQVPTQWLRRNTPNTFRPGIRRARGMYMSCLARRFYRGK